MSDIAQQPAAQARSGEQRAGRSLAEWVTAGAALLIVAAIVGLIVYDWLAVPPMPPVLEVRQAESIRTENDQFYIPFEVHNAGGGAAEAVRVLAELTVDGEVVEEAEQEFDFVAVDETRSGEFVFSTDPSEGELELRVTSFQEP